MRSLDYIAWILVIVGGLNWLVVGVSGVDVVAALFSSVPAVARAIYILVGLSAIYLLISTPRVSRTFGRRVAAPG